MQYNLVLLPVMLSDWEGGWWKLIIAYHWFYDCVNFTFVIGCWDQHKKVSSRLSHSLSLMWCCFCLFHAQPSIPPGLVNEYQLWLGRQRQVWLIPLADETQDVQVKLWYPLTMCAIPERLRDVSCIDITFTFISYVLSEQIWVECDVISVTHLQQAGNH